MRALAARFLLVLATSSLATGCGGDVCEEARDAFCAKACECDDGRCLVRLGSASLQYYDTIEECIDLAGPQICNSEGTEQAADACLDAVSTMGACGDEVAPPECVVSPGTGG